MIAAPTPGVVPTAADSARLRLAVAIDAVRLAFREAPGCRGWYTATEDCGRDEMADFGDGIVSIGILVMDGGALDERAALVARLRRVLARFLGRPGEYLAQDWTVLDEGHSDQSRQIRLRGSYIRVWGAL